MSQMHYALRSFPNLFNDKTSRTNCYQCTSIDNHYFTKKKKNESVNKSVQL